MAFSFLPSLNAAQRQVHPKLEHIRSLVKSPGRNVSVGIGGRQHMGLGAPAGIGIKPPGMAFGGHYDDGGSVDDAGGLLDPSGNFNIDAAIASSLPSGTTPLAPQTAPGYSGAPTDPLASLPSQIAPQPPPGTITGQPSLVAGGNSPQYRQMMQSAGPAVGNTVQNPDGSVTFTPPADSPSGSGSGKTGLGGWLSSRHGGISGADWLKAALIGSSGVLSTLASKHGALKPPTSAPQVAPTFKPIGVPLAFAGGGMVAPPSPTMGIGGMPPYAYRAGGMVGGPGDGMSDSIPVNNGQGALSKGEYVLDADTVSQIGNGDNDAGAAKLDMARKHLQMIKHGRPQQPPRLPAHKNPVIRTLAG